MNQEYDAATSDAAGSEQWAESFADGTYDDARDAVLDSVERVEELDPRNRQLVWSDGERLSFDDSVKRICAAYPTLPAQLIRSHLFGWLEQGDLPGDLSEEESDELDALMEPWIDELEAVRYQA